MPIHLCLFEDQAVSHFSPLSLTRSIYHIRTGAYTNMSRLWEQFERPPLLLHSRTELAALVRSQTGLPVNDLPEGEEVLFVNGRVTNLPASLIEILIEHATSHGEARLYMQGDEVVAAWSPDTSRLTLTDTLSVQTFDGYAVEQVENVVLMQRLWHLIDGLASRLITDINELHRHTPAAPAPELHASVTLIQQEDIYIAPNATVAPGAILSAEGGPIYIDENASVLERALVKGPFYLGQHSVIKPRADVSMSALGPVCKAGGEVTTAIMQAFSNKAHEGFLGHSYVGEWCNIGAGTNTSNLKNDYSENTLFNETLGTYEPTGRQFLGIIMGDHCKAGISSMFNTASVIGPSCNVFGSGFMPRQLPAFSWGCPSSEFAPYRLDKALQSIERVMARRDRQLSDALRERLEVVFRTVHAGELLTA